jgi:hypothetical protein
VAKGVRMSCECCWLFVWLLCLLGGFDGVRHWGTWWEEREENVWVGSEENMHGPCIAERIWPRGVGMGLGGW